MTKSELLIVTAWEVRVMLDISEGLTYRQIATRRGRNLKAIERTVERLRDKLRPFGGGSKAGLVHWIDTYHEAWMRAVLERDDDK